MARFDPKSYAKNVLRSAGYITVESVKGVNPTLTSYLTETANASKEMYDFVKDFRRKSKDKMNETGSGLFKEVDKHKKNILDDIRTGKFYNPEREKKALDEYMKKEGFSFDDIDFDVDENFGEDEESSSVESTAINNLSKTQQKLTAASTDEIVRSGKANARMTIKSTNRAFGMVNNSLAVINTSILNLHQDLAKPLNTHIINSSNFYQAATSELATQTKYLENINRILTERYETRKKGFGNTSNYKGSAWEDVFGGGLPNFRKWGQHAKSNFMNSSSLGFVADLINPDMMDMISGSGALSSPIAQLAIMGLTSKLQSSKFGKSLNRTEDILKGGFAHMAARISSRVKGRSGFANKNKYGETKIPFLDTILSAFDITPKANNKIDHSKYHRGPIDWDGESKKALTEVIPQLLSVIANGVNPSWEPKVFNYKTGRFETNRQAVAGFKKGRSDAIAAETSRFKSDITRDYIDSYNARLKTGQSEMSYNSKGAVALGKDFDRVMQELAISRVNPAELSDQDINMILSKMAREGKISKSSATALRRSFKNDRARLTTNILNGRTANNRFMADAAQGTFGQISNGSGITKISNDMNKKGSYANTILSAKDNTGHDIYWYLQNFYKSFRAIEHNMSMGSFSGRNTEGMTYQQAGEFKTYKDFEVDFDEAERSKNTIVKSIKRHKERNKRRASITDVYNERTGQWEKSSFNKTERKEEEKEKSSIFTKGVDKINDLLTKMFIGNTNIKQFIADGGLIQAIKDIPGAIKNAVEDLKNKAKEWLIGKWNKFKESDGGKAYFGSLKDQAKGIGRELGNTAKQYAGEVKNWFFGNLDSRAANGGFVTKSGMVSVSEGEMIIPSEMNPYYRGRTNKSSQRAREAMNYRNWVASGGNKKAQYWGSYGKGGDPYKDNTIRNAISELVNQGITDAKEIKAQLDAKFNQNYNINRIKKTASEFTKNIKETADSGFNKVKEFGNKIYNSDIAQDVLSKLNNGLESLFGSSAVKDSKEIGKEALKTVKSSLPQTMASGTIGAIVGGAMTGSGLGLLGGFAVAAGVHVLKNSDDISKKVFGEEDSNGNMTGGILSPKVSTFLKKRVPSLAKSGALGTALGLTGLVPGGILGGFLVGAGVDILANNDTIKSKITEAIFGYEVLIKKEEAELLILLN